MFPSRPLLLEGYNEMLRKTILLLKTKIFFVSLLLEKGALSLL